MKFTCSPFFHKLKAKYGWVSLGQPQVWTAGSRSCFLGNTKVGWMWNFCLESPLRKYCLWCGNRDSLSVSRPGAKHGISQLALQRAELRRGVRETRLFCAAVTLTRHRVSLPLPGTLETSQLVSSFLLSQTNETPGRFLCSSSFLLLTLQIYSPPLSCLLSVPGLTYTNHIKGSHAPGLCLGRWTRLGRDEGGSQKYRGMELSQGSLPIGQPGQGHVLPLQAAALYSSLFLGSGSHFPRS